MCFYIVIKDFAVSSGVLWSKNTGVKLINNVLSFPFISSMKISLFTKNIENLSTEALVIGIFEDIETANSEFYDNISDGLFSSIIKEKEFMPAFGKIYTIRLKNKIKRLVLLGLGKKEKFDENKAREAAAKAAVFVRENKVTNFSFVLFEDMNPYNAAYTIIEGVRLSLYQFLEFRTSGLDEITRVDGFTLVSDGNNFIDLDRAIRKAIIVCDAVNFTRDMQNNPSNVATPTYIAEQAKKLAKKFSKVKCKVLEKKEIKKEGMGGLLAVNSGSLHPPKFIIIEYNGGKNTLCFVGKGITFDSGGISIKPSTKMEDMKFDMSGGAVVLGLIYAAARLNLPFKIIGLIPATENLPGGSAYKPGDIVRLYNGKTAEIINTDAEGRLVLADALAYSKRFNPSAVIDFATLTGACVVSLGDVYAGVFSDDNLLCEKLINAGEKTGEILWRLPLHDKYKDGIKSSVADIKNCGPREGGAISAAMFLKEFVGCKRWAHIDIAGTAYTDSNGNALNPKGGTGFGVRIGIEFLENLKDDKQGTS